MLDMDDYHITNRESQARCFIALAKRGFPLIVVAIMFFVNLSILCFAASPGDVVINEVAWMGTAASTSDEWIELHNTTDLAIDIGGWSIHGADTGECINFSNADGHTTWSISAHDYLIYANHEDDVNDADGMHIVDIWDTTISMNNTLPGQLILYDGPDCTGNVIDRANQATGNWYAGEASPGYITMERCDKTISGTEQSNWATNDPDIARTGLDASADQINGTPKARNSATNTRPNAHAGADQVVILSDIVQLDGSASSDPNGDSLSYSWAFVAMPSGSAAVFSNQTVVTPRFVADTPGDYVLQLAVEDDYGGSDTDQVTITAQAPPVADFAYFPSQSTTWDEIQFVDQSSDSDGILVDWSWDFGDGETANDQNAIHRYSDPGTYQVALTVTDNDRLTESTIQEIRVSLGPGDITGDGAIDVIDVRLCLQMALGVIDGTLDQREQADVDTDGDVDLADAQILADYIIGICSPLLEGGQP